MKLKPKLEAELKPGSRVISHDFPITGWIEISKDRNQPAGGSHKMYLYRIPESIKKVRLNDFYKPKARRIKAIRT